VPSLTQLGSNLFLGNSTLYGVVIHTDEDGQTWVAHHTDKTRNYRTDWDAQKVAAALDEQRTFEQRLQGKYEEGKSQGKHVAKWEHNKLPWYKRIRKKE
jgi:hypothetical protein